MGHVHTGATDTAIGVDDNDSGEPTAAWILSKGQLRRVPGQDARRQRNGGNEVKAREAWRAGVRLMGSGISDLHSFFLSSAYCLRVDICTVCPHVVLYDVVLISGWSTEEGICGRDA